MSNVTITQFVNSTAIFKSGSGIPELIIPKGQVSFRTSKFDASGVIQQDDLIVVIYKDQEIPIRVLTDVITIKSSPTDSGVVFSSLSGTTVGKLLDLKVKLDEVFPKAGVAASLILSTDINADQSDNTKGGSAKAIYDFVVAKISALVNSSPAELDTLKELADAMGDDANFAATMTTALGNKVNTVDVLNSLTQTVAGKVLDARQGKVLYDLINSIPTLSQLDDRYTPVTAENYKTLTDAPVINWAYVNGDIATINISSSVLRTSLNITGIVGASIKTGELFVTHTDAGTTIPLPGNSDNVGWNPGNPASGSMIITWLAFRYFNSQFNWTSNFPASVAVDTAAPVLLSAIVSGFTPTRVRLTFNENLSSKVNFLTTDFTFATGRTATAISVSGPYLDIDVNTAYTTADIGSMKISGGNSKIKDIVGNTITDLVNQDISFTDIVLTANAVLPLTSSAAKFGGPVAIELLNKDSSTLVTRAGTVNKVRFVLSAVPTGCTFGIIVWRKNGTGYDLVMRAIYDYTKLVVGTNTDIVPTPFSVLVGDNVGFIYTTPGTTGAWIPTIDNAVAASSRYTTTSPATPTSGYLWDSKSASTSFSPIQLVQ